MSRHKRSTTTSQRVIFADLFHNETTAWLVLALSLAITALGWWLSSEAIEKRANDRFSYEVREAQERIQTRIGQYQQLLRGGVALFTANQDVSRATWKNYVSTLNLQEELPGVQGFAFAQKVMASELSGHIDSVRADGFPQYGVTPSGQREVYFPITLIEPFDTRNQRAFGYDMFSEPVRRQAMMHAMDTGNPTVSGLVKLKQEDQGDPKPGFLIYLPVYNKGFDLSTEQGRRQAIRGFVYSPFRASDLMSNVLGNGKIPLSFQLYDSESLSPESLLYDSRPHAQPTPKFREVGHVHSVIVPIELSGRVWTAQFESAPDFDRDVHSVLPTLILVAGGVIDLLLFLTIYSLVQQRRNQSASKAKSMFLASMSHEIRTPLNAILGLNNLLKDKVQDPQSVQYLEQIQHASNDLLGMLDDVLIFTQIESGSVRIESIEFDVRAQVHQTLELYRKKATAKGLVLQVEIDPMTPARVCGDPTRYSQVLASLLSNALKFSAHGAVQVKVQPDSIDTKFTVIRTTINDEGEGFDVAQFDRLIKPFEQADNTSTRRFGGTGLGLSISTRLCRLMGGELSVESKSGSGSEFAFTVQAKTVYAEPAASAPAGAAETISLKGKKILVVEDNRLNQHVIKALLSRLQADVVVVDDGQQAVDAVRNDPALQLVLMDVHMPVMNGIDATVAIRQLPGDAGKLPIIALTACALQEDERACREAGMNDFLTKPVNVPVLNSVLGRFLLAPR